MIHSHSLLLAVFAIALMQAAAVLPPFKSSFAMKSSSSNDLRRKRTLAVVAPGPALVTGTIAQGVTNAVGLYSSVIYARIALSWFPQLVNQFPILRPIFTVTEPYLGFFRKQIPTIGGFDLSVIPAIFLLDIMSQTVAAIGAEYPEGFDLETVGVFGCQ